MGRLFLYEFMVKLKKGKTPSFKSEKNFYKSIQYAKFFGCPVIKVDSSYYIKFEEQKFLTLTKNVLEDSDMSKFGEYIYSPASSHDEVEGTAGSSCTSDELLCWQNN